MSEVKIIQEESVAVELLASSIVKLSDAAEGLSKSGLTRHAIVVLIKNIRGVTVSRKDINEVLDALPKLKAVYIQKKP